MTSSSAPETRTPALHVWGVRYRVQIGLLGAAAAGWAMGPLSSLGPGVAWMALCLAALLALRSHAVPRQQAEVRLAAGRWWWTTSAAMALAVVAMALHGEALDSLQDNARLWLGAGAVLLLVLLSPIHPRVPVWLTRACALGCALSALVVVSIQDRNHLPANAIPWAFSVGFLVCWLAPAVLDRGTDWSHRRWWAVALVLGLAAVLTSQTRGALVIMLWMAWLLLRHLWIHRPVGAPRSLAALCTALAVLGSSAWWDADPLRLREAGHELALAVDQQQANTSVGSRLEMWATAAEGIAQAPWAGHGISQREAAMRALGDKHAHPIWAQLRHFHNEYLNAWFDHGLLGLGAVLVTLLGLASAAHALRVVQPVASQQLWGLAVVHGVAGLTNVNTVHNLYTLALSLAATAALLGAAHRPASRLSGPTPDTP